MVKLKKKKIDSLISLEEEFNELGNAKFMEFDEKKMKELKNTVRENR